MIAYIKDTIDSLDGQPTSEIMAGRVAFPAATIASEVLN
jgi:hypothetical protein